MTREAAASPPAPSSTRRSPLRSKVLLLAILITALGGGLWAYAASTRPQASAAASSMAPSSLSPEEISRSISRAVAPEPRLIDRASPAITRFGGSFVIGFIIAFMLRKVLRWSLLVAGAVGVAFIVARQSGYFQGANLEGMEKQAQEGLDQAGKAAVTAKDWLMGYVPSAGAALTGMFFGARRR